MIQDPIHEPVKLYAPPAYEEERAFLSLKWKISLLSSLILLAVVLLFCTISYLGLMENFDNQRNAEYQRYEREVDTLIKSSSQELRQIAEMIPFLEDMSKVLHKGDKERINTV
ncbi:MAG: GGDEF domain-containing protein, partial [Nitrosomonas sp.]|nr:GGDEF domain-containing protein [Nitrosomonas sp.]